MPRLLVALHILLAVLAGVAALAAVLIAATYHSASRLARGAFVASGATLRAAVASTTP